MIFTSMSMSLEDHGSFFFFGVYMDLRMGSDVLYEIAIVLVLHQDTGYLLIAPSRQSVSTPSPSLIHLHLFRVVAPY